MFDSTTFAWALFPLHLSWTDNNNVIVHRLETMETRTNISVLDGVYLTIGWKSKKFTVYIPRKDTPSNKGRIEIHFDKSKDGNLSNQFAGFITTSLTNDVEKWETFEQMNEWVSSIHGRTRSWHNGIRSCNHQLTSLNNYGSVGETCFRSSSHASTTGLQRQKWRNNQYYPRTDSTIKEP